MTKAIKFIKQKKLIGEIFRPLCESGYYIWGEDFRIHTAENNVRLYFDMDTKLESFWRDFSGNRSSWSWYS